MRLRYMLTALPFTALLLAGCANTANEPPIGHEKNSKCDNGANNTKIKLPVTLD